MGSAYLARLGFPMPTLDERVAYLEGRVEEHSTHLAALRDDVHEIRVAIDRLADRLDGRMDRQDSRMDAFDAKLSRQFIWLVGIQIVMFIAMMSAIASR